MKKNRYIEIAAQIEQIEKEFEILDSNNPLEQTRISVLKLELDHLKEKIKLYNKEGKLSKFKLIEGQG